MAKGTTARNVEFAKEVYAIRPPREDEHSVMYYFARHAAKCEYCRDPYDAYKHDKTLCSRGLGYAKDVAKYLYAKGGKPFSVIDKQNGDRVQVEVPAGCEAVTLLIKAFDKGMVTTTPRVIVDNIKTQETHERSVKVVSPASPSSSPSRRRQYYVDEKPRERRYINDNYELVEIKPYSSRSERKERTAYREERSRYTDRRERPKSLVYEGKGSLYSQDEEERRRRHQLERHPVVILAEPGQRISVRR